MKIIKDDFDTADEAQKWASNNGLTGYIINGPNLETGKFCVKVMTVSPTEMGLEAAIPMPPVGSTPPPLTLPPSEPAPDVLYLGGDDRADLAFILNWYMDTTQRYSGCTGEESPQTAAILRRRVLAERIIDESIEPTDPRPHSGWRTDDLIARLADPHLTFSEREAVADELRRRAEGR